MGTLKITYDGIQHCQEFSNIFLEIILPNGKQENRHFKVEEKNVDSVNWKILYNEGLFRVIADIKKLHNHTEVELIGL